MVEIQGILLLQYTTYQWQWARRFPPAPLSGLVGDLNPFCRPVITLFVLFQYFWHGLASILNALATKVTNYGSDTLSQGWKRNNSYKNYVVWCKLVFFPFPIIADARLNDFRNLLWLTVYYYAKLFHDSRAQNNGRSTDNARPDRGLDWSNSRLASHFDRSFLDACHLMCVAL